MSRRNRRPCSRAGARIKSLAMTNAVRDNAARHRFELDADGHVAFSNYQRDGDLLTIMHTEVPAALNGRGIGSALVRGLLDIARAQELEGQAALPVREVLYRQASANTRICSTSAAFRHRLTQSLPFGKTLGRPPASGARVGFFVRHCLFLRPAGQAVFLARLAFLADVARRGACRLRRCISPGSGKSAAAASARAPSLRALFPRRILMHRSNQADIFYLFFNVFMFSVVFGWAILSYQFISNGIIAGLVALLGPVSPSTLARLCHAHGHHADAVSRLRARLLVQPLAQPQGAVVVGIPQSAPHRRSAHAADQFPRASGLRLDLRQHPRLLRRGRQRLRPLHVRRHDLSIRARRHQHHPGAVHPRLRAPAAFAYVDFVPRLARARARLAGASSGAPLRRSETLQQEFRLVPGAVGLDVRHALYSGQGARTAHLWLSGSAERAHGARANWSIR